MNPFEMLEAVSKGKAKECQHCGGYGSSLKEPNNICTVCGGSGIIPIKENTNGKI